MAFSKFLRYNFGKNKEENMFCWSSILSFIIFSVELPFFWARKDLLTGLLSPCKDLSLSLFLLLLPLLILLQLWEPYFFPTFSLYLSCDVSVYVWLLCRNHSVSVSVYVYCIVYTVQYCIVFLLKFSLFLNSFSFFYLLCIFSL